MPYPLRPLGLGELLDRTFSIYRRHFVLFVGIAVPPYLVLLAMQLLFFAQLNRPLPGLVNFNAAALVAFLVAELLLIALTLTVLSLVAGGAVAAVGSVYLDQPITIGTALKRALRRLPALVAAAIVLEFVVTCGIILLIVPGIIFLLCFAITFPVIVLEDVGPFKAMGRSWNLTKGYRLQILAVLVLFWVVMGAISGVVVVAAAIIIYAGHLTNMMQTLPAIVAFYGFFENVLVIPILTIALALFYFDFRVRKEAFDIQLLLQRSEAASPAAPSAQ